IPIIIKNQDLRKNIPKKLSENIEILQEKHPLLIYSLMDNRDWNVKELCEKILVIDNESKIVKFMSFILSKISLLTQLEEIGRKDKKETLLENPRNKLLEWAKKKELANYIMQLAGRKPVRIGQSFKCILHEEKHPSASWFRTSSGEIIYRDWHKEHGSEFYTLAEVYYAIKTKKIKKLSTFEKAKWLEYLIIEYLTYQNKIQILSPKIEELKNKISYFINILNTLKQSTSNIYIGGIILDVDCQSKKNIKRDILDKIFIVLCFLFREFCCSCLYGYSVVLVSERFLAESLDLEYWEANRILNLLCVLGFFEKSGDFEHGDRITFGEVSFEEIKRRFDILFPDGKVNLRKFNFNFVVEKLGREIAEKTFRRVIKNIEQEREEKMSEIILREFKGRIF
ncbi:MAG: hypothetical protein QXJ28_03320, partial [Candidatus Pacearchaeota archaeon]